jgi:hypothetical protein
MAVRRGRRASIRIRRRLTKSSGASAWRQRDHPQVQCHYGVLRDHQLVPRLAAIAGVPLAADLDRVIVALRKRAGGRRVMLLIHEADPFFREDAAGHHAQLTAMRALSEEGACHFLLAGFWDLYSAALLDYQSPLRNFGESLRRAALHAPVRARRARPAAA